TTLRPAAPPSQDAGITPTFTPATRQDIAGLPPTIPIPASSRAAVQAMPATSTAARALRDAAASLTTQIPTQASLPVRTTSMPVKTVPSIATTATAAVGRAT